MGRPLLQHTKLWSRATIAPLPPTMSTAPPHRQRHPQSLTDYHGQSGRNIDAQHALFGGRLPHKPASFVAARLGVTVQGGSPACAGATTSPSNNQPGPHKADTSTHRLVTSKTRCSHPAAAHPAACHQAPLSPPNRAPHQPAHVQRSIHSTEQLSVKVERCIHMGSANACLLVEAPGTLQAPQAHSQQAPTCPELNISNRLMAGARPASCMLIVGGVVLVVPTTLPMSDTASITV